MQYKCDLCDTYHSSDKNLLKHMKNAHKSEKIKNPNEELMENKQDIIDKFIHNAINGEELHDLLFKGVQI